jgi:hypothetical protein
MKRKKSIEKIITSTIFNYRFSFNGILVEGSAKQSDLKKKMLQEITEHFSELYDIPKHIVSSPMTFPDREFVWIIPLIKKENLENFKLSSMLNGYGARDYIDVIEVHGTIDVEKTVSRVWK